MRSPGPGNVTSVEAGPSSRAAPLTLTVTVASLMLSSVAKTLIGRRTASPTLSTRGSVARAISGFLTCTDRSALPKASPSPATTITRTSPRYAGMATSCFAVAPAARWKGPRWRTMGGKRLALATGGASSEPSPPIASRPSIAPPYAPSTSS